MAALFRKMKTSALDLPWTKTVPSFVFMSANSTKKTLTGYP